jgi:hypothetical protein
LPRLFERFTGALTRPAAANWGHRAGAGDRPAHRAGPSRIGKRREHRGLAARSVCGCPCSLSHLPSYQPAGKVVFVSQVPLACQCRIRGSSSLAEPVAILSPGTANQISTDLHTVSNRAPRRLLWGAAEFYTYPVGNGKRRQ